MNRYLVLQGFVTDVGMSSIKGNYDDLNCARKHIEVCKIGDWWEIWDLQTGMFISDVNRDWRKLL